MLCFHYFVNGVDNHTGGFDQWETKNHVHAHLGSGSNNKRGLASILGEIGQVKLKCQEEVSCDGPLIVLDNS